MPDETNQPTKKPRGWSAARQHLATWGKPALLALVKDLYDAAAVNRDFIQARCQADGSGGEVLEKYRSKIVEQFFPKRGEGKLKLGEARKAIRDYRKATGNLPGTAELLLTYVENGTRFTHEYGDIDERFYSSVESALDELAALLRGDARELYWLGSSAPFAGARPVSPKTLLTFDTKSPAGQVMVTSACAASRENLLSLDRGILNRGKSDQRGRIRLRRGTAGVLVAPAGAFVLAAGTAISDGRRDSDRKMARIANGIIVVKGGGSWY